MTWPSVVHTFEPYERFQEPDVMKNTRTYLLAVYTIVLGALACVGWLYIGQADDAPGAGMIGFAALLSSLIVAYRVARAQPCKQ